MPELPPWLTQPADPGKAFLQGAQTGSVIAQSWNQTALARSRLRLGEQEEQINALKIKDAIKQRDDQIEAEFILDELGGKVAQFLEDGKPSEARTALLAVAARKTAVFNSPRYGELLKHTEAAVQTETTRMQLESMAKWRSEAEAGRNLRAQDANDLKFEIESARRDAQNDPNNIQNWVKLAKLQARLQGLDIEQGNLTERQFGTKARAHSELSKTLRQEMRAIDSSDIPEGQKVKQKAIIMRRLEESQKGVLGEIEGIESVEVQSMQEAVEKIDKDIADLKVDMAKEPNKGILDFGEDNRTVKIRILEAQRDGLRNALPKPGAATQTAPLAPTPVAPTATPTLQQDKETVLKDARNAILNEGKPRDKVIQRLRELGITEDP